MNLLLTCSTVPEFGDDALGLWNRFCIAEWMPGHEIVSYLRLAPTSAAACIDAIVFLQPNRAIGFGYSVNGRINDLLKVQPWEAHYLNAEIALKIRGLPEACAMQDGRKWKRIPQVVLTDRGFREQAYDGIDVKFVVDVTDLMLHDGYASPITWSQIERVVNEYHKKTLDEYERVGFMITADHGRYRVKRAFHKKAPSESEYYYGGKDKRRFRGYVTIGRESEGVDYEALLFEQLLNEPKTGEREVHNFLEQHPHFLAEAMMGVPISHQPYFPSHKQTPDFAIAPILPREDVNWVKLVELKGPDAKILENGRFLHRALAQAVTHALAQVNNYNEHIYDPLNLKSVSEALGYIPEVSERAVLIGRAPSAQDADL